LSVLKLASNKIPSVPDSIGDMKSLEQVDLSMNRLTEFPSCLLPLTHLTSILLSSNEIPAIPDGIGNLTNLNKLEMRNNKLEALPDTMGALVKLQFLILEGNSLKALPESLTKLTLLRDLNVRSNKLKTLPREIGKWAGLRRLIADYNELESWESDLTGMDALEEVDVRHNKLTALPASLKAPTKLYSLFLDHNLLKEFPVIPTTARELRLSMNRMIEPHNLGTCGAENLQILVLAGNALTSIPDAVSNLKILQLLDLSFNNIKELPEDLTSLTNLRVLNISCNRFTQLPDFVSRITILENLSFGYNQLDSLPDSFQALTNLKVVHAGGNKFSVFPTALRSLPALKTLILSNNMLTSIGDLNLPQLEVLDLSHNLITDCKGLEKLKNLGDLALNHNMLTKFPSEILGLEQLHDFTAAGNQIPDIPEAILKMGSLKYAVFTNNRLRFGSDKSVIIENAGPAPGTPVQPAAAADSASAAAADAAPAPPQAAAQAAQAQRGRGISDADLESTKVPFYAQFATDTLKKCICVEGNPDIDRLYIQPPEYSLQQSLNDIQDPVPSYSVAWAEMCGRRSDMQDALCIVPSFQGMQRALLAGVYDGHSGSVTSRLVSKRIHTILSSALFRRTPDVALHETYKMLYHELEYRHVEDGATALTALLLGNKLYIANAGDCRAVLCREGRAVDLSVDQKPTSPSEMKRIHDCGGVVSSNGRVNGELAVSRSLGDIPLQPFVTWEPDVMCYTVKPGDEFIILACDGVWDVLSSQQAVNIVRMVPDAGRAACTLRDFAYLLDSGDNLSSVVIRLNWN